MIPIVTPAEMREIDAAADQSLDVLIERAGWSVAARARQMLGGVYGRRVAILAGPGNNGADAVVAARILRAWGVHTEVYSPDHDAIDGVDLVIDGAFGTGTNRPYHAPAVAVDIPVLAIDNPSGIDGLTGECLGAPLEATTTVTFAALKPGLLLGSGALFSGRVEVVDIGLDTDSARAWLIEAADVARQLPRRRPTDHKWNRAVFVIGGSPGMLGAPTLASHAALRTGSGMVWCGVPGASAGMAADEVVFRDLSSHGWADDVVAEADRFGALVVGCGLGRSAETKQNLAALLARYDGPMVVDGDGLRLLGTHPALRPNVVLTPHDGEFAALTGGAPKPDRFEGVRRLAVATGATVLLKGPLTIVAAPDGRCLATNRGDERLATAGTGDVLAGVIGALLAAGLDPIDAAGVGAWLHGEAGSTQTRFGMVASDLVDGLTIASTRLLSTPHGESDASH